MTKTYHTRLIRNAPSGQRGIWLWPHPLTTRLTLLRIARMYDIVHVINQIVWIQIFLEKTAVALELLWWRLCLFCMITMLTFCLYCCGLPCLNLLRQLFGYISEHYLLVNQIFSDLSSAISCAVACLKVLGIDCVSYAYDEAALTCIVSSQLLGMWYLIGKPTNMLIHMIDKCSMWNLVLFVLKLL